MQRYILGRWVNAFMATKSWLSELCSPKVVFYPVVPEGVLSPPSCDAADVERVNVLSVCRNDGKQS